MRRSLFLAALLLATPWPLAAQTVECSPWTSCAGGGSGGGASDFTGLAGSLACSQTPAYTGDVSKSAGSCTTVIGANKVLDTMVAFNYAGSSSEGGAADNGDSATGFFPIGQVEVAHGGTGASSLTNHGVVVGAGTSAVNVTSPGTAGQVLTSNGASADPTFQAAAAGDAPAGSGSEIQARASGSALGAVTGSSSASGGINLVSQSAAAVPLSVTGAASQSANLLNVTADGGTAGALLKVAPTFTATFGLGISHVGSQAVIYNTVQGGPTSGARIALNDNIPMRIYTGAFELLNEADERRWTWNASTLGLGWGKDVYLWWSSHGGNDPAQGSPDTSVGRLSAGIFAVGTGAAGATDGAVRAEIDVASKTTAYTILATDTNRSFDNLGATASVAFTLPAAAPGIQYAICNLDSDGLSVVAVGDDTITVSTATSAAAGNVAPTGNLDGACLRLVAHSATRWIAESVVGSWSVN